MPEETLIGKRIDRYEIKSRLGRGEVGTVYRAYQPGASRMVAIKLFSPDLLKEKGFLERFREQAQAIGDVEHFHVVPLLGAAQWEGSPYLVMRYMPGGSLADLAARYGTLTAGELLPILQQVAEALDYAHQHGVLHRNIKPTNILLDEEGNAYLSDFALDAAYRSGGDGPFTGSPAYRAPELAAADGAPSPASDLYALAVTAFRALTGYMPYKANTPEDLARMHVEQPVPSLRALNGAVPVPVETVIRKAMAKNPADRYPSAGAFVQALSDATSRVALPGRDPAATNILRPLADQPLHTTPPPMPAPLSAFSAAGAQAGNVKVDTDRLSKRERREVQRRVARQLAARERAERRARQPWYTVALVLIMLVLVWSTAGIMIGFELLEQRAQATLAAIHASQTPAAATFDAQSTATIAAYLGGLATQTQEVIAAAQTATAAVTDTPTPTLTSTPSPSPTPLAGGGSLIAYVSERDGDPEIFTYNLVDGTVLQLTQNVARDNYPAWSPDGRLIAFQSDRVFGGQHIYTINARCNSLAAGCEGSLQQLTTGVRVDSTPIWSPDGTRIAFVSREAGRWYLRTVTLEGEQQDLTQLPGEIVLLDWSPDGFLTYYGVSQAGSYEILRLAVSGTSAQRVALTESGGAIEFASYSPDRTQVVFQAVIDRQRQLFLADATCPLFDQCVTARLTTDDFDYRAPRFSPDGTLILATSNRNGNLDLYVFDLAGTVIQQVTDRSYDEYNGVWQPVAPP